MKFSKVLALTAIVSAAGLIAQGAPDPRARIIDREAEKQEFPDLFNTEKLHEANIQNAYQKLSVYGHLVSMAQQDRQMRFNEVKDPLNLKNMFRFIQYTPRNTYIRYVKEDPEMLLLGFGALDLVQGVMAEKVKLAVANGVAAKDIQFQGREGIELTKFTFIYDERDPENKPIGSRRKSVTLFYTPAAGQAADSKQKFNLDFVVAKIVDDNFYTGYRDIELIMDPSPMDEQMEDMMVLHRQGMKELNAIPVGMLHNTPNYPHRMRIKQRFLSKLLDDFDRLYTLVDSYAKRDGNDYNDKVILELENQLDY